MTTPQLTEQDIEEMERTVEKATAEPWLKGHNPTSREPMEYIAEAYSYGPPGLVHLVCAPVDGKPIDEEARFTAITGNGPTSEANAAFIARARSFVPRAIADLRRLRDENERLARDVERLMGNAISEEKRRMEADKALTAATERAERAERELSKARRKLSMFESTLDDWEWSELAEDAKREEWDAVAGALSAIARIDEAREDFK